MTNGERGGGEYGVRIRVPELVLCDLKGIKEFEQIGRRLKSKINQELKQAGRRELDIGTWTSIFGYLSHLFKLKGSPGELAGLRVADIGGGSYDDGNFGPNLARALAYSGAEVSIIDPAVSPSDGRGDAGLKFYTDPIEKFTRDYIGPIYDLAISNAFFGSPNIGKEKYSKLLLDISKISPVQIHSVQFDEFPNQDEYGEIVKSARQQKIEPMHFPPFGPGSSVKANYLLVDNRQK